MTSIETERAFSVQSSPKVGRDRLEDLLESMRLDEKRGAVWELKQCIERCTLIFAEAEDQELNAEFEAISRRAMEAFAFEAEHGARSLFNHEHPFNQMLDQAGLIDLKSFPRPSPASGDFWTAYFSRVGLSR